MAKRAGQVSQSQNAAAASGQKAPKVQKVVGFKGGFFFGGERGFPEGVSFGKEDYFVAQSNCNNKRRRHFGHARAPNLACKCYFPGCPPNPFGPLIIPRP